MADKLTRREKENAARLERAVRAISVDSDLQYLFLQIFHLLGCEDGIPTESTNLAMTQFGRQQAAVDIRAILMSYDVEIYAKMLLAEAKELNNQKDDEDETEYLDS